MNKQETNIENLLPLYIDGKTNQAESAMVESWLAEDESHREIYETEMALFRDTDSLYVMKDIDVEQALEATHGKMRKAKIKKLLHYMERVAAIMVVPLLIVVIAQFLVNNHAKAPSLLTIRTNPGMTTVATLPDGTEVILNSNSVLTYPAEFVGRERRLSLQGEAYFSVTKDAEHPFIVSTSNAAAIKVYGTKFNVEAYPDEPTITATLQEGSIAMLYKNKMQKDCEQKIVPGEKVIYSDFSKSVNVENTDVEVAMSWTSGKFIFRNTSIEEVLNTLSKRYDVDFKVQNKKVYSNAFTGTLEKQRLDRILEILELSSDIRFKYIKNPDISQGRQLIEVY